MGLDSVELVLAVEEKFGISISDEEACAILTVGEFHRCVMSKLATSDKSTCLTQEAFHLLRRNVVSQFGISRRSFRPDTQLDSVIPRTGRREQWLLLQRNVGATRWPALRLSGAAGIALLIVLIGAPAFVWWYGTAVLHSSAWLVAFAAMVTFFTVTITSRYYTRPFMTEFEPGFTSVRDLALTLVADNPQLFGEQPATWTDKEVWSLLCSVIEKQTGVTDFSKDSRIVADLGID